MRLTTRAAAAQRPYVEIVARADRPGAGLVSFIGLVDSGADYTCLPIGLAGRFGFTQGELTLQPGTGAGGGITLWRPPVGLRANIVAHLNGQPQLWGPTLDLTVVFSQGDQALLGRCDFFRYFVVTFEEDHSSSVFHLDVR